MAFEVIALADESLSQLGSLLERGSSGDSVWSNDFCRAVNVVDKVLRGSYNLIAEIESTKTGGALADS